TCLSHGRGGVHHPPCHVLELSGLRLLLECPLDLSALAIFAPVPSSSPSSSGDLVAAPPWYKAVAAHHLFDPCLLDAVVVSSPAAMLGLPFLARNPNFSAKIYATEVTARIGGLMMEELVAMHSEFVRYYGSEKRQERPDWMKWEELERLPIELRNVVMGEEGEELGSWMPQYSAAEVKECMQKVVPLKYAEEVCFNGAIILKAFSSGLEIGSSNWMISSPRRSITYLSSSIFESGHAMGFDYHCSLQGNDLILFSDLSSMNSTDYDTKPDECNSPPLRTDNDNEDHIIKSLSGNDENLEEIEKISFICSCIVDSLKAGGSVLIPIGRLGILLQLLEYISQALDNSNLKVPIFMVSATAEETLSFTNAIPEWLCKERQEKLFLGKALFGHAELIKEGKLCVFPLLYERDLLMAWQEPCIVFSPHWSLRFGSVVQLLNRWHSDHNSLLILEQEVDAEMALLPFKTLAMKVLQCSFLSGLKMQKVQPLLELLRPKLVLFPEVLRPHCPIKEGGSFAFLYYSENVRLRVPNSRKGFEVQLATELAFQLEPRRLLEGSMAIARLQGRLLLSKGKYLLVSGKKPLKQSNEQMLLWGSVDPARLILALEERGIVGSICDDDKAADGYWFIQVSKPEEGLIKSSASETVISCDDERTSALIFEALCSVCDGI
ncbi:Integrator complex subunit 9, partial [Ananas comosus]